MAKEFPQLKQVNIPSTVQVRISGKKGDRVETKGAIRIELSLKENELSSKHIGYQESSKKVQKQKEEKYWPKDDKPQYREKKEEPKKFVDKSRREESRKYREKDFEDERGYR